MGFVFFVLGTNATEINVKYDGVKCSSCIKKFTKAFNEYDKQNGGDIVSDVKVNWEELNFTVITKGDKDIPDAEIKKLLKEKGYNVVSTQRKY